MELIEKQEKALGCPWASPPENLFVVMAVLELFEEFSGKFGLNF